MHPDSLTGLFTHFWFSLMLKSRKFFGLWMLTSGLLLSLSGVMAALFVHDLDLLVDHLAGKPVDRDVHPVVLFAFDDEIVSKILCIWFVVA